MGEFWRGTDDGYVFITGWGEPLYPDTVTSLVRKIIEARNEHTPEPPLPHARLHDLRHLHATTLLLAGVPVHVVAARLGHADPSVTLRVYAHVIRSAEAAAADIFADAVKPPAGARVSKGDRKRTDRLWLPQPHPDEIPGQSGCRAGSRLSESNR
jgi:integrase